MEKSTMSDDEPTRSVPAIEIISVHTVTICDIYDTREFAASGMSLLITSLQ
jgi:hypothetical protein